MSYPFFYVFNTIVKPKERRISGHGNSREWDGCLTFSVEFYPLNGKHKERNLHVCRKVIFKRL